MRYVTTADEMKEIEKNVINEIGISSLVLMERAALGVSDSIKHRFGNKDKICVVCGSGNNGADGVAIARQLLESHYKTDVVFVGNKDKISEEMNTQLDILSKLGIDLCTEIPDKDYACFVDAILGIGLTRDITDEKILNAIRTMNLSDAYIYSVDIPSGIHTDTGTVMGDAVKANETITFSCEKVGICIYPGKGYAGCVKRHNIGIMDECFKKQEVQHYGLENRAYANALLDIPEGNKGSYGKIAVIAGNAQISGAAVLCAKAAMKCGAGMVKVVSHNITLDVIRNTLPEVITEALEEKEKVASVIQKAVDWANCVVIGPGIGVDELAYVKLQEVLKDFPDDKILVVDADGVNLLGKFAELKEMTKNVKHIIYTPHMMELSRFIGVDISCLKKNLDSVMSKVLEEINGIFVCKDCVTRIYKKGRPVFINRLGNSGMATAGCGDVLAGMVAAHVAGKGADVYEGTVYAVHHHSFAGDLAAENLGKRGILAGDIIDYIPYIWETVEDRS